MKILTLIALISFAFGAHAELVAPKNKGELKAYYDKISERAKLLKSVPDEALVGELLQACVKARKFDSNIFCLDSISDFYVHFPMTVEKVAKEKLSKDESEFVLKRLNILKDEIIYGNDPSVDK